MAQLRVSDMVAVNIRQARQRRGWSQAELGSRCGLSGDVIQHIESGRRGNDGHRRRDVTVDELLSIADALEMNVRDLLPAATFMPHRSERERAIKAATTAIQHEEVKLAALAEVQRDLEEQRARVSQQLNDVRAQIGMASRRIAEERATIELIQSAGDRIELMESAGD